MKKDKIYISGPMTVDQEHYLENFAKVAKYLEAEGYEVLDPSKVDYIQSPEDANITDKWSKEAWVWYIKRDIDLVTQCDAIYMMSGWKDSNGALVEFAVARRFGLKILYQNPSESLDA